MGLGDRNTGRHLGAPLPITSMSSTVCVLPACVFLASEDNVYVTVHSISLYLFMACKQYKLLLTFKYIMLFERLLVFLSRDSSLSLSFHEYKSVVPVSATRLDVRSALFREIIYLS